MPGRLPSPPPPQELPRVVLWRRRRNPLRRRSDLVQAWIGLGLLLAALTAAPAAMFLGGDAAYRHYTRTARHQAETRHQTTAVLLEDVPRHPEPGSAEAKETRYPAKVRFTDPEGHTHTATTDVQPALPKGSTVRVWAGTDGKVTDPPLSPSQIRSRAMSSGIVAALGVHATAAAAYGIATRILHRRNLAAWDTAWADTAPRWTTSS
ncbi:Rv1733c family protein [Streptomyces siamensis]|uniref:Proline rich protein membrane protein n=1 Tax=Streptomyces siamensis TaxID=1274986 RepID=A0ABP9J8B9_9ACTN